MITRERQETASRVVSTTTVPDMKRELTFKNEIQELSRVTEFVERLCEDMQLDMHISLQLQLVMEEMATNVISYAYPEGTLADISLSVESNDKELVFILSDSGKPFDPTAKEEANLDENPMNRKLGGLGIHIMKNIMDEVSYRRSGSMNQLTMKKIL